MSSAPSTSDPSKNKTTEKEAVEAIEEDDEFEEFEPAHWAAGEEVSEDTQQWQDNWDVDDMDDEFTKNLREELIKNSGSWAQVFVWENPLSRNMNGDNF